VGWGLARPPGSIAQGNRFSPGPNGADELRQLLNGFGLSCNIDRNNQY
jgi:hypothetical protein